MEKYRCGYTVLSLTVPGIQDHHDKLGAFVCLSMHDAKQAGEGLRRCVTKYGFHGALLNDFQHAGKDGTDYLYYDQPTFDPSWQVVQELDIPVYLHPAAPADYMLENATLNYCIDQLGADRILFSVDSPYETYRDGCTWFDDYTQPGLGDKVKIGRSNDKALLKIDDYVDQDVPVIK